MSHLICDYISNESSQVITRFSVAGPHVWNSLPADLQLETQSTVFKRLLKRILFSR